MTLRHIQIFVSVYQHGSITRAAEAMHLAQPAVSLAVSELERYYGIHLFDRISRRLYVTEEGRRFYDYALHIVSLFDDMETEVRNWDAFGTLRVGTSITIGNYILPSLTMTFRETYPDVKIKAFIHNSSTIEQYVLDNKIDLGLIEGNPDSARINAEPFLSDRLCFIAPFGHPLSKDGEVTLEQVASYDFLLRERGSAGRNILEGLFTLRDIHLSPLWESSSTQAIITAVSGGIGISFLPYLMVERELKEGKISEIRVKDVQLSRQFSIIYHKNKYLSSNAREFMELCRNHSVSTTGSAG